MIAVKRPTTRREAPPSLQQRSEAGRARWHFEADAADPTQGLFAYTADVGAGTGKVTLEPEVRGPGVHGASVLRVWIHVHTSEYVKDNC